MNAQLCALGLIFISLAQITHLNSKGDMYKSKLLAKYIIDLALWSAATPIAFWLRLEGRITGHGEVILVLFIVGLILKAITLYVLELYKRSWHRSGLSDLIVLGNGIGLVSLILFVGALLARPWLAVPLSAPIIEGLVAAALLCGARVAARLRHRYRRRSTPGESTRRALIAGAGDAGTMLAREMQRHPQVGVEPVGFLDDDPVKQKEKFRGLPVLGSFSDLEEVARDHQVDEVILAFPSAPGSVVRSMVERARAAGVQHRVVPGVNDLLEKRVSVSQVREVKVEDLLRREPVQLETEQIERYVEDQVVLVTGAGGSIGSELARQLSRFSPRRLLLLGRGENSLYRAMNDMRELAPELTCDPIVANIRDLPKLEQVFREQEPDLVFHAAAHKHVPLMEQHPDEAVLNNVQGTRNLVNLSLEFSADRLVNISTDKAVHPTSVMGATKLIAEHLVRRGAERAGPDQQLSSVRFGNVLGSRGSVVPLFKQQIKEGGPVTITHPDMRRYFMTIPEAAQLVLQAGAMDENGATYVLNMGEPVRIENLARDLIQLSGFQPGEDIPIEYIGKRPGEKLYEELVADGETVVRSHHDKVMVASPNGQQQIRESGSLSGLIDAASDHDEERVRRLLDELIVSNPEEAAAVER